MAVLGILAPLPAVWFLHFISLPSPLNNTLKKSVSDPSWLERGPILKWKFFCQPPPPQTFCGTAYIEGTQGPAEGYFGQKMQSFVLLFKWMCNSWLQHARYSSCVVSSVNYFQAMLPFFGKLSISSLFTAGLVRMSQSGHKAAKKCFLKGEIWSYWAPL